MAIAPDGTWLAEGGQGGSVRIWDASAGLRRAVFIAHSRTVRAVAIAPDGSWLADGGWNRSARIWDVATGQPRASLADHHGEVRAVAIAPDGTWLATSGGDGSVRIWDASLGNRALPSSPTAGGLARWRSPPTAPGSPPAETTARSGSGIPPPASSAPPSPPTAPACARWRSPRTAPGSPQPAASETPRSGSGPATGQRAPPSPATAPGRRGRDRPGRDLAGRRRPGQIDPLLGCCHRAAARSLAAHRARVRAVAIAPGRHLARQQRRRHGPGYSTSQTGGSAPPSPPIPAG